jgi:(p)ppGpp synthase/HD superfamily hydrolase
LDTLQETIEEQNEDEPIGFNYVFDIETCLKFFDKVMHDFPKMTIKKFPKNLEIEHTPVFYLLLERFNMIYESALSITNILNSRSSFNAFYDFVFYCALNGKITIPQDQLENFMISLNKIRKKYNQNLRTVELYHDTIMRNVFYPKHTKRDEIVRKAMYRFDQAYSLMKLLFEDEKRNNGARYFDHLKGVMEILLTEFNDPKKKEKPDMDSLIIALLHDVQEDLPEYADVIRKIYGNEIADGVAILSKKDWTTYMDDEDHQKCDGYLTVKQELLQEVTKNVFQKRPEMVFTSVKKIKEKDLKPYMNPEQLARYQEITNNIKPFEEKYKKIRNEDYFGHMDQLSDKHLKIKFADRIHNLRDIEGEDRDKLVRKVRETEQYFLELAKKRHPIAYEKMMKEIIFIKAKFNIT